MKIDRQIGMLSVLLQRKKVTVRELAEKFEVSHRTVMRDIDDICRAGIPIVSEKGRFGGISIMENYKIDKTLLTASEMNGILAGLKGLDSVSGSSLYRLLMEKLSPEAVCTDNIIIDLSSWGKEAVAEKIEFIRSAIDSCEEIEFTYYSPNGSGRRIIEPYSLVFQWSGWYIWGWCEKRQDYRMFKLTRLTDLRSAGKKFSRRDIPAYSCDKLRHAKGGISAEVRFDDSVKWRIIDEFGTDMPVFDSDGSIRLTFSWWDVPSFYQYILSFGDNAEIISPEEYRRGFKELLKNIIDKY